MCQLYTKHGIMQWKYTRENYCFYEHVSIIGMKSLLALDHKRDFYLRSIYDSSNITQSQSLHKGGEGKEKSIYNL